jgi:hypothetical protein
MIQSEEAIKMLAFDPLLIPATAVVANTTIDATDVSGAEK